MSDRAVQKHRFGNGASALPRARHRPRRTQGREKELRRRLEQAEVRYRALLESLPIVTYIAAMDVHAAFIYISPQVEALLGFKPEEWILDRRLWLNRMPPEDRRRILPLLGKAHRTGGRFSAEYRLRDRGGRLKWIRDESRAVRDEAGRAMFIHGTWTEITDRKKSEGEKEDMGRELSASRAELKQLVSIASHELKAPLRRIVNLGESLARRCRDRLDPEENDHLTQIRDSAASLQELIEGLVEYAETDQDVALSAVDMDLAAKRAGDKYAGAADVHITYGALPKVWAEPALLERILHNLIHNAVKFRGKEPVRIHISAKRGEGERWIASVRDNGVGMQQRDAQRVFSIFERPSSRTRSGVGLGLAICKKIVERFGGRIWVESEPEEGSTFHFTLLSPPEEAYP